MKPFRYFCAAVLLITCANASVAREGDPGSRFSTDGLETVERGRIPLAGARLWAPNLPGGAKDFDYGVARLQGGSAAPTAWSSDTASPHASRARNASRPTPKRSTIRLSVSPPWRRSSHHASAQCL